MEISIERIKKAAGQDNPFFWVDVTFFKEIDGKGVSASVDIPVDDRAGITVEDIEKEALLRAKAFLKEVIE